MEALLRAPGRPELPGVERRRVEEMCLRVRRSAQEDRGEWEELRRSIEGTTGQVIHGDMHAANVIWSEEAGYLFADFDKIAFGPAMFDVAKYIAISIYGPDIDSPDEGVRRLLQGYRSVEAGRHALDTHQLLMMVRAMQFQALWPLERLLLHGDSRMAPYVLEWISRTTVLADLSRLPE